MQITVSPRRVFTTLAATALLTGTTLVTAGPGGGSLAVAAGAPASVGCSGAQQGVFTKSVVNSVSNVVALTSTSHSLSIPTDASTGQVSGKRSYRPYTFNKITDSSTIGFLKAAINGENLTSCTFRYYIVNSSGTATNYYTVTLTNARVSSYSFSHSSADNESWSLVFQKITWNMSGTVLQDCPSCAA